MKKEERAKKIEEAIKIVWDSLDAHLSGTYELSSTQKKYIEEVGSKNFHKMCVREYAQVIKTLSELY